jgi:ubiquinone/menaquinone biosynthesis C-methylase UbiE
MPDLAEIYAQHADQYELLVAREDYQGNIFPALNRIRDMKGLDVVDLGAGTGRLTCMLAPLVRSIRAFDTSQHMLDAAVAKLEASALHNWEVGIADHRQLPLQNGVADVAISGWSLCYAAIWCEGVWHQELRRALAEMKRVLRPGGTIIVLETLGTGHETPHRYDELQDYLAYLDEHGFSHTWIRTDYRFKSLAEAEELSRFFFGDEMGDKVREEEWVILPECTGIWWKDVKWRQQ